jgi:hypothetical protein
MRKSIDPMSDSDKNWERQLGSPAQCSSAAMSFQSAIPWQVALRQSLPPLHRLATILNNPICRTMIFQRTATIPLTSCLTPWVHFTSRPFPLHPKSLPNLPPLRSGTSRLADSEHLLHNHHASVASLRQLFTFAPECVRLPSGIDVHRNTQLVGLAKAVEVFSTCVSGWWPTFPTLFF